ncbi:MAG: lipoyl(octanoyl) transferase [Ignavibacteria bacterium]|nr:MAG: lipoyl(octanoyl) transferase [Ignavibacteria bacterium]KAF0158331.1 MAG: lipoyl(octanoyl) transferase [Ignavibacteria bacterium]
MANQSTYRNFDYCDLGFIDYQQAWDLQKDVFAKRVKDEICDTFFMLEHPHTYTLGKVAEKENLISSQDQLKELGVSVYEIDRGGDITYHGPGQIVGYPIIKLSDWKEDTHEYLRGLEEVIMKVCSDYGLDTHRNVKYTGVWIGERKIAAIGIKVSRWTTMHGFAFNVNTDLNYFGGIIPCGIRDKDVTSLKRELGRDIPIEEVKEKLIYSFKEYFDYFSFCVKEKSHYLKTVVNVP